MARAGVLTLGLIVVLTALPVPAGAQAIQVIVDGRIVGFDQPPRMIGGRVLVPLRGVFEHLGASVRWDPRTSTVFAERAGTLIVLVIGSRQARIDNRPVSLDVPPLIFAGRTLVPLRFLSEALGAGVNWDPATRAVHIFSAASRPPFPPAPPPVLVPPRLPPTPEPPQQVVVVEGTVVRVEAQAGAPRIVVRSDGVSQAFFVAADTTIIQVDVDTNRRESIDLLEIRAGDLVRVTADAGGRATRIRVSVREVTGRVDRLTRQAIILSDGRVFVLGDEVRFFLDGREVSGRLVQEGAEVTLRINPQTQEVVELRGRSFVRPPVPLPSARILSVAHHAAKPLRSGEVLTVTLRGTPGGMAMFDLSGVVTGVDMPEIAPGIYRGAYTVRSGDNAVNAFVVGHLRLGTRQATSRRADTAVTVDTVQPLITRRRPEPGSLTASVRPTIVIEFTDRGGSGMEADATRLFIEDDNVTDRAVVTATSVTFTPRDPLSGRVVVRLVLRDRAGNRTDDRYTFTVAVQAPVISSVTVHPTGPVRAGDVVTISMFGDPRGQAAFTIEGVVQGVPMAEAGGQPGLYVGTYTVRSSDPPVSARIIVQLTRGDRVSRAEAPVRLTIVPAPLETVRIISLAHDALGPLRAGNVLTVTLRGTPGGAATFDLLGVVTGVEMREGASGVYQGAYTVRSGDNAVNAAVVGHLRVGPREAPAAQAPARVTVDTQPPQVTRRRPEPNSTVSAPRPEIAISFVDRGSGIDAQAVRLFVEDDNVTDRATVTEATVTFTPRQPLSGRVSVRVVLPDRAGNRTDDRYAFTVTPASGAMITSVTVQPAAPVSPGDVITVTMVGEPGGQAVFTIEGIVQAMPMTERDDRPGVYTGRYTIRPADAPGTARVIVRLTRGDRVSTAEARTRVTIVGAGVAPPAIVAPAAGARVGVPLVIRGTGVPGSKIVVRVDYRGPAEGGDVRAGGDVQGTFGEVTTTVDRAGNWQVVFKQAAPIRGAALTITARTVDAAGRASTPVAVVVTQT